MNLLFTYREAFREIASKSSHGTHATIITWVDVILAKLGDVAMAVAVGFSLPAVSLPEGIRQHIQEDILRAAAQLPRKSSC